MLAQALEARSTRAAGARCPVSLEAGEARAAAGTWRGGEAEGLGRRRRTSVRQGARRTADLGGGGRMQKRRPRPDLATGTREGGARTTGSEVKAAEELRSPRRQSRGWKEGARMRWRTEAETHRRDLGRRKEVRRGAGPRRDLASARDGEDEQIRSVPSGSDEEVAMELEAWRGGLGGFRGARNTCCRRRMRELRGGYEGRKEKGRGEGHGLLVMLDGDEVRTGMPAWRGALGRRRSGVGAWRTAAVAAATRQ